MIKDDVKDIEKRLRRVEQQTAKLPSRIGFGGGGGGGTGGWEPYVEAAREDLPADPPDGSLGYVTGGTYAYGWFSFTADGWRGLNFWEQE